MEKKRVAFIVSTLNGGGIENYLLRFIKHYKDQIDATVICKLGYAGDLYEQYIEHGVKVETLNIGFFNPIDWYKFFTYLKKTNFSSICDFTGNFAGIPLTIAKVAEINTRVAFYRGSTNRFKEDGFRLIYNKVSKLLVQRNATNILSNSVAALNFFFPKREEISGKYEVVYNGINSEQFCSVTDNLRRSLSIPQNAFVIGHVGRLDVAKNHKTILDVALRMCTANSNIYFIICGKGVDEAFMGTILNANLTRQIKLLGYRSDVNKVLNTMNAFYFPSVTEGQPNALIEAMVIGLPFVASNIEPILETVPADLHMQLVAPKDVDGAIEKLSNIYHSHNRCEYICAEWAKEKYSADSCFSLFMEKLK